MAEGISKLKATSFRDPSMQKLLRQKGVEQIVFDQCTFGLLSEAGVQFLLNEAAKHRFS